MLAQATVSMDDEDVEEEARKIIEESAEMGDNMADPPPEGQKCERCDRDAVSGPPLDGWLCRKHQQGFFKERHG